MLNFLKCDCELITVQLSAAAWLKSSDMQRGIQCKDMLVIGL